jgi:hypothetical protein
VKPRRQSRHRRKAAFLWEIQRHRLGQIARGEIEPRYEREHWFQWTLRARGRANYADFILPGLLFMAEHDLAKDALAR